MTFTDIFDTKVVDNEVEEDGTPFMTPSHDRLRSEERR